MSTCLPLLSELRLVTDVFSLSTNVVSIFRVGKSASFTTLARASALPGATEIVSLTIQFLGLTFLDTFVSANAFQPRRLPNSRAVLFLIEFMIEPKLCPADSEFMLEPEAKC